MFAHAKRRNLFLTGMMATGKSTIGEIIARKLAYVFIDTDAVIERQMSLPVTEIFAVYGEDFFRQRETSLLPEIISREHQVIATGGGMLTNHGNMAAAFANGLVILLHAPIAVLATRLSNATDRPLLDGFSPEKRLQEIYDRRAEFYEGIRHQVDTSNGNIDQAAEEIVGLYMNWLNE
ncbi:MAG: shikimate kinase [candidate division Zixibacteria bacterium]|nr:shikimate kinase [candidate division Zixibacteria bacterium]